MIYRKGFPFTIFFPIHCVMSKKKKSDNLLSQICSYRDQPKSWESLIYVTYKWYLNFKIKKIICRCKTDTNKSLEILTINLNAVTWSTGRQEKECFVVTGNILTTVSWRLPFSMFRINSDIASYTCCFGLLVKYHKLLQKEKVSHSPLAYCFCIFI